MLASSFLLRSCHPQPPPDLVYRSPEIVAECWYSSWASSTVSNGRSSRARFCCARKRGSAAAGMSMRVRAVDQWSFRSLPMLTTAPQHRQHARLQRCFTLTRNRRFKRQNIASPHGQTSTSPALPDCIGKPKGRTSHPLDKDFSFRPLPLPSGALSFDG